MYEFFKNIVEKKYCQINGVCSIHPSVISLHELITSEIREIAFYLVKLKEFSISNYPIMDFSIEALSIFMVNTNFNQKKYINLI